MFELRRTAARVVDVPVAEVRRALLTAVEESNVTTDGTVTGVDVGDAVVDGAGDGADVGGLKDGGAGDVDSAGDVDGVGVGEGDPPGRPDVVGAGGEPDVVGQREGRLAARYEWSIEVDGRALRVVERQRVSSLWLALVAAAGLVLVFGRFLPRIGASGPGSGTALTLPVVLGVAALGILVAFVASHRLYPSPLVGVAEELDASYRTRHAGVPLLAVTGGLVATGDIAAPDLPIFLGPRTGGPGFGPGTVGLWLAVVGGFALVGAYEAGTDLRTFPFDLLDRLPVSVPVPSLSAGYVALLLVAGLPVYALALTSFVIPFDTHFYYLGETLYLFAPLLLLDLAVAATLWWAVVHNRTYVHRRVLSAPGGGRTATVATALAVVGTSYLAAGGLAAYFGKFHAYLLGPVLRGNLTPLTSSWLVTTVLVVSALPLSYFLAGLAYAAAGLLAEPLRLFVRSSPAPLPDGVPADPPVRVRRLHDPGHDAASLDVGVAAFVFLPAGIYEDLSERERAAVVAHEQAHVAGGDARLALATGLASLVALTGRNVLLATVDFRERERRADDYAAAVVGEDALAAALRAVADGSDGIDRDHGRSSATGVRLFPFSGRFGDGGLGRAFGLFFGSFALAQSHPSLEERLARLEDDRT